MGGVVCRVPLGPLLKEGRCCLAHAARAGQAGVAPREA